MPAWWARCSGSAWSAPCPGAWAGTPPWSRCSGWCGCFSPSSCSCCRRRSGRSWSRGAAAGRSRTLPPTRDAPLLPGSRPAPVQPRGRGCAAGACGSLPSRAIAGIEVGFMDAGITAINDRVREGSAFADRLRDEIATVIVGQRYLVDRLLIGLLATGHVILGGVPGLAKPLSVKTLAQAIQASFRRVQFTPALLPADLIGTQVYSPRDGSFTVRRGPIFAQLILADEINRAPA